MSEVAEEEVGGTLSHLRRVLPDWWDLHIYVGGALVAYGGWLAWPPLGSLLLGSLLLGIGAYMKKGA